MALATFSDLVGESARAYPCRRGGRRNGRRWDASARQRNWGYRLRRSSGCVLGVCRGQRGKTIGRQSVHGIRLATGLSLRLEGRVLPMMWDFAEANPIGNSSGNILLGVSQAAKMLEMLGTGLPGSTTQADAASQSLSEGKIVSTDPPYYDNVPYADLSDFFYVWLRRSCGIHIQVCLPHWPYPKSEELVAFAYRHDGKAGAGKPSFSVE